MKINLIFNGVFSELVYPSADGYVFSWLVIADISAYLAWRNRELLPNKALFLVPAFILILPWLEPIYFVAVFALLRIAFSKRFDPIALLIILILSHIKYSFATFGLGGLILADALGWFRGRRGLKALKTPIFIVGFIASESMELQLRVDRKILSDCDWAFWEVSIEPL